MAKQQVKSALAGKLGGSIKPTEIEVKAAAGGGRLPAGIENGIAELVDCRVSQYKEGKQSGEYFFLAAGVVINPDGTKSPWLVNGTPVDGLRTQIMEPLCDTPERGGEKARKTAQEHYEWVVNEVAKLLGKKPGEKFWIDVDDLEAVCEQVKEMKPVFRFRTFSFDKEVIAKKPNGKWGLFVEDAKGNRKPSRNIGEWVTEAAAQNVNPYAGRDPMVFETWAGACEDPRGEAEQATDTRVQNDSLEAEETPVEEPAAEETPSDIPYGDDLDDLVATANDKNAKKAQPAIDELGKRAMAVGYSDKEVTEAKNWEEVAEMVRNPKGDDAQAAVEEAEANGVDWAAVAERCNSNDKKAIKQLNEATKAKGLNPDDFDSYDAQAAALSGGDESADAEEQVPAKGEIWQLQVAGQKKPKEFIIETVNAKKKVVTLIDNDTKKPYVGKDKKPIEVAWSDLIA